MNKTVIKFGLVILIIAVLFPPVKYVNGTLEAFDRVWGTSGSNTEVTIRPIWNVEGEYPMTEEEIHTSYLLIEIVLIIALTFGIAYVTEDSNDKQ